MGRPRALETRGGVTLSCLWLGETKPTLEFEVSNISGGCCLCQPAENDVGLPGRWLVLPAALPGVES